MVDQSLTQLIKQVKQGDKQAFARLVDRYKRQVFYQAYAMLKDREDAEDIAQEAFIKAFFSMNQLESAYAFTAWLSRIVYNLCQDRIKQREKQRRVIREWIHEQRDRISHSGNQIEQKQVQLDLKRALQRLTLEHRTILVLREIQGLSYREISEIIGVPEGTVKSRIHNARLSLRAELEKEGGLK